MLLLPRLLQPSSTSPKQLLLLGATACARSIGPQLQRAAAQVAHAHENNPDAASTSSNSRLEVDSWGAVSSIPNPDPAPHLHSTNTTNQQFVNADGLRVEDGRYRAFLKEAGGARHKNRGTAFGYLCTTHRRDRTLLWATHRHVRVCPGVSHNNPSPNHFAPAGGIVPSSRLYTDPLHLLAYGSDASFYRLIPKAVIKVHSEQEVVALLQLAQRHKVPVTFRAAGTSLSGQAVTDSVVIQVRLGAVGVDGACWWC